MMREGIKTESIWKSPTAWSSDYTESLQNRWWNTLKACKLKAGGHSRWLPSEKLIILCTWVYEQNNLWTAMVTGIRVAWKRKWESPLSINQSYMLYENYYRTVTGKKNQHHYYKNSNQTHLWIKQEHIDRDELITAPYIPRLPKTQPNERPSTDFKSERKTWELAITQ